MSAASPVHRVGIIGGGLAGLAAARTLDALGKEAVVFDKGRGPGGRSSSRRAEPFAFDHGAVLVTAPPAQAAALIGDRSPLGKRAAAIRMQPCWAVMLGMSEPYSVPFDGAFCESAALSWISRDSSKPERPSAEAWVLHATPEWTLDHIDDTPERIADLLVLELERSTGVSSPGIRHRSAHLWRFARPYSQLADGFLEDRERGLVLAGDAYCGGRVEGAYMSGVLAARRLHT